MAEMMRLTLGEAFELARQACAAAGAHDGMARSLAEATVSAEARGRTSVGFSHLPDYLAALEAGRIDGKAEPVLSFPAPCLLVCDVRGGIAQLGFNRAREELRQRASTYGIALLAISNSFLTGELGWYVRHIVDDGLVALAATNGSVLMKPPSASAPVYCTNPIAFGAPGACGTALLIDQASSATAFVSLRKAAEAGEAIPPGWAVDRNGNPTTDARAAIEGALLTFGGSRGANIALIVEVLAAGLTGTNWSLDAPCFASGAASPGAGLLLIAINPTLLDSDFEKRLDRQAERLSSYGVYIPGRRQEDREEVAREEGIYLPRTMVAMLKEAS